LAIAFVATFVGATTFHAAQWDLAGTSCTRTLGEAQLYEVIRDQSIRTRSAEHARLQADYNSHVAEGSRLLGRAAASRRSASAARNMEPGLATVGAQLQFAIARTLAPALSFTDPRSTEFLTADERLSDSTRSDLRETILRNGCPNLSVSGGITPESFVDELKWDVEAIHAVGMNDATIAVLFVVILILLTLSDYAVGFLRIGLIIASCLAFVGTTFVALARVDPSLSWYFLMGIALYAAIAIFSLTKIILRDLRHDATQQSRALEASSRTTPSFFVLLIIAAALVNGIGGTLYSAANGSANVASAQAQSLQLQMLRWTSVFQSRSYATIDGMTRLRGANLGSSGLDAALAATPNEVLDAQRFFWDSVGSRWQSLTDAFASTKPSDSPLDSLAPTLRTVSEGAYGPYEDPAFPSRYFVDRSVKIPALLFAQRDAFDEVSKAWDARAGTFLGTLAALSIAAYLGAEGLRVRKSSAAYVLSAFGLTALVAGILLGAMSLEHPIPSTDQEVAVPAICRIAGENARAEREIAAAVCFANAEERSKLHDDGTAANLYEAAVDIRPGFSVARYLGVLSRIENPQQTDSLLRAVAEEQQVIRDLRALGLNAATPIVDKVGYHELLLALLTGDGGMLARSVRDTKTAALARPEEAELWYHRGLADLANRDNVRGQAEYERAFAALRAGADVDSASTFSDYAISGATTTRLDRDRIAAADALSDLELLRSHCSVVLRDVDANKCVTLSTIVEGLERKIISNTWSSAKPESQIALGPDTEVVATPGGIGWRSPMPRSNRPGSGVLVMVVSVPDGDRSGRRVLPDLSYQIDPVTLYRPRAWVSGYRSLLLRSRYSDCLRMDVDYRVDFFVNGRLVVSTAARRLSRETFTGVAFREPGAAMCYPQTWLRNRFKPGTMVGGYRDARAVHGATIFGYFDERPPRDTAVPLHTIELAVEATVRALGNRKLDVSRMRQVKSGCNTYFDEYWTQPHLEFELPTMTLLAKGWRTRDGLDVVGVVWQGPGSHETLSCAVLTSMTTVDRDVPFSRPQEVAPPRSSVP